MSAGQRPDRYAERGDTDGIYEETRMPRRPMREQNEGVPRSQAGSAEPRADVPTDPYADNYAKKPRGGMLQKLLGTRDDHDGYADAADMNINADEKRREPRRPVREPRTDVPADPSAEPYAGNDEQMPHGDDPLGLGDEYGENTEAFAARADREGRGQRHSSHKSRAQLPSDRYAQTYDDTAYEEKSRGGKLRNLLSSSRAGRAGANDASADYDDYGEYYDDGYDDGYYEERKSRWWIAPLVVLGILMIIAAACFALYSSYQKALEPVDPSDTQQVEFVVEKGATTDDIANNLEAAGLTRKALYFKVHSKLVGNDGNYRQGAYLLSRSMSMDKIMETIIDGSASVNVVKFTIPEGLTTTQTVKILVDAGLGTQEDFTNEIQNGTFDYAFLEGAPKGENRLEGFLYPNTYEVYKTATAHDVIDTMLKQFDKIFTPEFYEQAKTDNCTVYEIVTIASMIERETRVADERAVVARVIYNRLKKNMRLQIDATVQYALPEVKKFLSYEDLKVDSPYNTYLHDGLPPGPICSPRVESISAALWPDKNDYLFYVLKPEMDGSHNFAETESEFFRYKEAYSKANGLS
jgi:UPF0755 protein